MSKIDYEIVEFSDKYQKQVVNLVGSLLVFTGAISKQDLPIDDEDLTQIASVYGGKSGFWLAVVQGKLIGTVGIKDVGEGVVKLKRMFVLPDYHGSGIGQTLFDYALQKARERGFTKMILNTNEHMERAHHFYEKNGFLKTGQTGTQLHYEREI